MRLRMLWVLLSAVAFIFLIAHLNQLSRQYLEESLAMEEKRHLNSLTKANQKIDLLYNELLQYRQSYQTVVEQFSEEVRDQEEALAEQVYQNVLRESAKEFERFRVIDNPKLENIQSLPLRSLLSARMMEAKRSNIPVTCDIPEEISGFTMNVVDLTLLVSIFFSNAIDESKQVPASQIKFSFIDMIRMEATILSWKIGRKKKKLTLMPLCRKKTIRRPQVLTSTQPRIFLGSIVMPI